MDILLQLGYALLLIVGAVALLAAIIIEYSVIFLLARKIILGITSMIDATNKNKDKGSDGND